MALSFLYSAGLFLCLSEFSACKQVRLAAQETNVLFSLVTLIQTGTARTAAA